MGYDADAMAVATATPDGAPSARMVLLKGVDDRGLLFFTNYSSRRRRAGGKPAGGAALPLAAARPPGAGGGRGVPDGSCRERSVRPQPPEAEPLSALASPQSAVVPDRAGWSAGWRSSTASTRRATSPGRPLGRLPREPETWEFWEHRDNRLHDRHRYTRTADGWRVELLAPWSRDTAGSRSRGPARASLARRSPRAVHELERGPPARSPSASSPPSSSSPRHARTRPGPRRSRPRTGRAAPDRSVRLSRRRPAARTCTGPPLGDRRPTQPAPVAGHAERAVADPGRRERPELDPPDSPRRASRRPR